MNCIKVSIFLFAISSVTLSTVAQIKPDEKPKFGPYQCRADTQKWTYDPFDKNIDEKFRTGTLLTVNGQYRVLPELSYGVTAAQLIDRIYEMGVCGHEDAEFQQKFNTYASIEDSYRDEETFRYKFFVMNHHLEEQFASEDAQKFK